MAVNAWLLIWPNHRKILGLIEATAEGMTKAKFVPQ